MFELDPLADERWNQFVESHPHAGIFHTTAWLRALQDTYNYRPTVVTTSASSTSISNGLLLCDVKSWITGRRLVSLPFSDHCNLLYNTPADAQNLIALALRRVMSEKARYVEFRPGTIEPCLLSSNIPSSETFTLHKLPLTPSLDDLFRNFHKDCIQRKVRRAQREALGYVEGCSELVLRQFYNLLLRTRRRHGLPPQPLQWFQNLVRCMGNALSIHVAYHDSQPVSAMLTLRFKQTITYKYGCSDERYAKLGGTPFLFWKVIEQSKNAGLQLLDLGRSEPDNTGLLLFKDRLGAVRETIHYYRTSDALHGSDRSKSWAASMIRRSFSFLPDSLLVASGKLLYRHIG